MCFLSGLTGLVILIAALVFALGNRQPATLGFWPFAVTLDAPLSLLLIGALAIGLLLGGVCTWVAMLPHQLAARRLRQDIGALHGRLDTLQQSMTPLNPVPGLQYKARWPFKPNKPPE